jgi:hypothetical protein
MDRRRARALERACCYAEAANDAIREHGEPAALLVVEVTHEKGCKAKTTGNLWDCHCAPDIAAFVQL